MNTEQLRTMVNHMKIEPEDYMTTTVDGIEAQVKAKSVTDMIARALCVEYNEACDAEDGLDFYYKASEYVNKQYCALIAISHDCWSDYFANVERVVALETRMNIALNHEYLEAKKEHRIKHMEAINKKFYDFVLWHVMLLDSMNKKGSFNLDIEK